MHGIDRALQRRGQSVFTRTEVLAWGGDDSLIGRRLATGYWVSLHAGVYLWGPRTGRWMDELGAAVAAAGPGAVVSHRAAWVLWGLDGISTQLVEITVPYECAPVPRPVIRHRTRRPMPSTRLHGLPVSRVERLLLDSAPLVPRVVLAKGVDSAIRMDLTSPEELRRLRAEQGGRGVRGQRAFDSVVSEIESAGHTGSPSEVELARGMRRRGLPEPTRQWEIRLSDGTRYLIDFGWPDLSKGVEVDGLGAHADRQRLTSDLARQNRLLGAGIQLRRYPATSIRSSLDTVIDEISRFLAE